MGFGGGMAGTQGEGKLWERQTSQARPNSPQEKFVPLREVQHAPNREWVPENSQRRHNPEAQPCQMQS